MNIRFKGISLRTGEEVTGWYWENQGIGYIVEDNENIQPPIRRTYAVDPETVTVVNQWVPVEEQLPGKYETVLVTAKMETDREYLVYEGTLGAAWELCGVKKSKDYRVLAWMPLPKPYRE